MKMKIYRTIKLMSAVYSDGTLTVESFPIPQLYVAINGGSADEEICEVPEGDTEVSFIIAENEYQRVFKPSYSPPLAPVMNIEFVSVK